MASGHTHAAESRALPSVTIEQPLPGRVVQTTILGSREGRPMSVLMMAKVWTEAPFDGGELLVLLALADYSNDAGLCWPAVRSVAAKARMTPRNVQRICLKLETEGWLKRILRGGKVTTYQVLVPASVSPRQDVTPTPTSPPPPTPTSPQGVTPTSRRGDAHVTQTIKNHQVEPPLEPSPRARARARGGMFEVDSTVARVATALAARHCAPVGVQVEGLLMLLDEGAKPEWFERISRNAMTNGKASWPYVAKIIERWIRDGPDPDPAARNGKPSVEIPADMPLSEQIFLPRGTPLRSPR